jgi:dolichol-phosphate mannosyltransferase
LRVIRRVSEKGLASAVVDGFATARGRYLVAMDADLQHDEQALPGFLAAFQDGAQVVVGSRKTTGGGIENWSALRRLVSWGATLLAKAMLPRTVSDPLSGYFGVTRRFFEQAAPRLNPRGFKILLEFLALSGGQPVAEVGYVFRSRQYGSTKLSGAVMLDYLVGLYELRLGRIVPVRFIKYSLVGVSGIFTNQLGLWLGRNAFRLDNRYALVLGIELSILTNFLLNNYWSFRDVRVRGAAGLARGFVSFNLICMAGAVINYAVALFLSMRFGMDIYLANLAGIAVATAWNYTINVNVTWKT